MPVFLLMEMQFFILEACSHLVSDADKMDTQGISMLCATLQCREASVNTESKHYAAISSPGLHIVSRRHCDSPAFGTPTSFNLFLCATCIRCAAICW